MPGRSGRSLLIKKDNTAIAGLRNTSVSFTNEGVDITDKLDNGYRTYGDFPGVLSFEISADGVSKSTTLRDLVKVGGSGLLEDITIEWDDSEEWECDVYLASYEETGAHDGEVEFSVTLESSGAWAEVT